MDRSSRFLRLAGLPVLCQVRAAKLLTEDEARRIAANIACWSCCCANRVRA